MDPIIIITKGSKALFYLQLWMQITILFVLMLFVYGNSSLKQAVEENKLNFPPDEKIPNTSTMLPYSFVADDAFKLTTRFMKPFSNTSSLPEKVFNYRLSRARRIVENAFEILASKFKILQTEINLDVTKVQNIVLTTCVSHNYIKSVDIMYCSNNKVLIKNMKTLALFNQVNGGKI